MLYWVKQIFRRVTGKNAKKLPPLPHIDYITTLKWVCTTTTIIIAIFAWVNLMNS